MSRTPAGRRIADVRAEIVADPQNPQLLVHVTTDDGLSGVGETWWGTYQPEAPPGAPVAPIVSLIDNLLGPHCLGADSDDIEGLWHRLVRQTAQYGPEGVVSIAISGIDLALWDLRGQRHGVPVHSLLGARRQVSVRAYASLDWLGDVDAIAADAQRAIEAGFGAVKLHESDPAVVLEARAMLDPSVSMMVDMSGQMDESSAGVALDELAGAGLTWVEEPIYPYQDHAALARLRTRSPIPIAAGENEFSVAGFRRLLSAGAVDVLQPDLVKCGGITPASAIADLAARHRTVICPHNFTVGPSLWANLHWAVTVEHCTWVEVPWLPEGHGFPLGLRLPEVVDGRIAPSDEPGLC